MIRYSFNPIGVAHSCFSSKFGVPRQSGLAKSAIATIELFSPFNRLEACDGLENVSHLWLQFVFHQHVGKDYSLKVRPPRLGGNNSIGVFASRAPYRPNAIGLSAVKLEKIETKNNKTTLTISGADLVDGTPILDIKPYVPYADSILNATNKIAAQAPERMPVTWSEHAENCKIKLNLSELQLSLIEEVISLDPRPAYQNDEQREYGMDLTGLNVRWRVIEKKNGIESEIASIESSQSPI